MAKKSGNEFDALKAAANQLERRTPVQHVVPVAAQPTPAEEIKRTSMSLRVSTYRAMKAALVPGQPRHDKYRSINEYIDALVRRDLGLDDVPE